MSAYKMIALVGIILLMALSQSGCNKDEGTPTGSENHAPTVTITSSPSDTITTSSATFIWSGADEDGNLDGYYYEMDGAPDNWTTSTSHTFTNLSQGDHTFYVKAVDTDGLSSTTASRDFYVSLTTHSVSAPTTPSGPTAGMISTSYSYSTSGGTCSEGHTVSQYKYSWGDSEGNWGSSSQSHSWSTTGGKAVKVKCKCSAGTESDWSSSLTVTIGTETVSAPNTPSGPATGNTNTNYTYSTSGGTCSGGHSVSQYKYSWGDSEGSWGSASQSHSWSTAGGKAVKAKCKCSQGTESDWSSSITVTIGTVVTVTAPNTPSGPTTGVININYTYATSGGTCSAGHSISQYRYSWEDSENGWGSASQSHSWSAIGNKSVKAKCKCSAGDSSGWSNSLSVNIGTHVVSAPNTPSGSTLVEPNVSNTYSSSGGSCNQGHSIAQYKFSWGDSEGNWGNASQPHSWSAMGSKSVKAKCKCSAGAESDWSPPLIVNVQTHTVSIPNTPSGPSSGFVGSSYSFSTSGGSCNFGHSISQYKFHWGDTEGSWGSSSQSHSWGSASNWPVKAKCICSAGHESDWSSSTYISISVETVSPPSTPSGPSQGQPGNSYTFTTGGGSCNAGHSITSYQFDWGNGQGGWGASSQSHSWSSPTTYYISARCQCSAGTISDWSPSTYIEILEPPCTVSPPSTPSGPDLGYTGQTNTFITGGGSCSNGHSIIGCIPSKPFGPFGDRS